MTTLRMSDTGATVRYVPGGYVPMRLMPAATNGQGRPAFQFAGAGPFDVAPRPSPIPLTFHGTPAGKIAIAAAGIGLVWLLMRRTG